MSDTTDGQVAGQDDDGDKGTVELTLEQQPPKRRIALSFGEQTVEVEGPDDLADLVCVAGQMWSLTSPPVPVRLGFGAGTTLHTEIHNPCCGRDDPDGDEDRNP